MIIWMIIIGKSWLALVSVYSLWGHIVHPADIVVDTCQKKYLRVVQNLQESHEYYLELTEVPTRAQVTQWEREISIAESKWSVNPEAMDVMEPKVPKHKSNLPNITIIINPRWSTHPEPAKGQITQHSCLWHCWRKNMDYQWISVGGPTVSLQFFIAVVNLKFQQTLNCPACSVVWQSHFGWIFYNFQKKGWIPRSSLEVQDGGQMISWFRCVHSNIRVYPGADRQHWRERWWNCSC